MLFVYHIMVIGGISLVIGLCFMGGMILAQFIDIDHYSSPKDIPNLIKAVQFTERGQVTEEFGSDMPFKRGWWHTHNGLFAASAVFCVGVVLVGFGLGVWAHHVMDGWWFTSIT